MKFSRVFLWLILIFGAFLLAAFFLFAGVFQRTALLPPFTKVGPVSVGFLTREEAAEKLQTVFNEYLEAEQIFVFEGEVAKLRPKETGAYFDAFQTVASIPPVRGFSNPLFILDILTPHSAIPAHRITMEKIEKLLEQKFSKVKLMRNAGLRYDPAARKIFIDPEQEGFTFSRGKLLEDLIAAYAGFSSEPVFLASVYERPVLTAAELEAQKNAILKNLPKRIFLRYESKKWTVDFPEDIEFLDFEKPSFIPRVSGKNLEQFMEKYEIQKGLENLPEGMKIYRDQEGKIVFEGSGKEGHRIDREKFGQDLENAVVSNLDSVQIPVIIEKPILEISEDLHRLGIRELIGAGYSTYYGSPQNRIYNIGVGVRSYNGTLVPPGETFSFNALLGPVDAGGPYKKELVIKHDGTKPEYGGGLCQVSTTMYRAAAHAGLPIIERHPHSYAVTYYSQVGGHGFDATIYPGHKDLKFLNDTAGHILIQGIVEGQEAYFKFYGTSDGREVSFEGPYLSNYKEPGPDEFVYTDKLPPGQKKREERAVRGFDAVMHRFVTKNGETEKETVFSRYRAVAAKYLVGGEGPLQESDIDLEAARQFE